MLESEKSLELSRISHEKKRKELENAPSFEFEEDGEANLDNIDMQLLTKQKQ